PYFYEEDNWTDDMELAATQLFRLTGETKYLYEAAEFGRNEPKTPWMGADTARHYQWYPFFNAGHYFLASQTEDPHLADTFANFYRTGLEADRKSTRLNSSHVKISYAVFCLKKKDSFVKNNEIKS